MVDANTIVAIATANLHKAYNSINSSGGTGYYTSTTPEYWCADFAKWVWAQAGADVSGLTNGVVSFAAYGEVKSTPDIGDAVLFRDPEPYQHVAIVVEIGDGTVTSIGGDQGNGAAPTGTQVTTDGPFPAAPGWNSWMGMQLLDYVSPRGLVGAPSQSPPSSSLAPAAVVTPDAQAYVFWLGTGGALWQAFGPGDGALQGPFRLGYSLGSAPTVDVDSHNRTFVYWKGTDANLWGTYWNNGSWQEPHNWGFGPLG